MKTTNFLKPVCYDRQSQTVLNSISQNTLDYCSDCVIAFLHCIAYESCARCWCTNCTGPEMIPSPEMIPKLDPKWSRPRHDFQLDPKWSRDKFRNGIASIGSWIHSYIQVYGVPLKGIRVAFTSSWVIYLNRFYGWGLSLPPWRIFSNRLSGGRELSKSNVNMPRTKVVRS